MLLGQISARSTAAMKMFPISSLISAVTPLLALCGIANVKDGRSF